MRINWTALVTHDIHFFENWKQVHEYQKGKEVLISEVLIDAHEEGITENLGLLLSLLLVFYIY